ncbi:MAG TPA: hypothetical protein VFZ62_01095 [Candidatus Saccharimonadales bacterium]
MPRVTPTKHYYRYQFLRVAWLEFPKLYALLPLDAQRQVHEFYRPSEELTKNELVTHIKALNNTKPTLVHQVGKHVRIMKEVFRRISKELGVPPPEWHGAMGSAVQHVNSSPANMETKDGRQYTISALARPEVNIQLLARALIELARRQSEDYDSR